MKTKIYILTEPNGEIRYVGKSVYSLSKRLYIHLYEARHGIKNHRCNWVRSVLSKGFLPIIQLIGEVEGDGCKEEIAWIKYFREENVALVNGTNGGEGMTGRPVLEETREKISNSLKKNPVRYWLGKHRSKETCVKIGLAHLDGKGNSGYKFTEEDRMNMSLAHKGKKFSEEWKRNIGLGHLGIPKSLEARAKISLANKKAWTKRSSDQKAAIVKHLYLAREKYFQTNLQSTGERFSPEARKNMSVAVKEWWRKRKAS